jgi:hypothetical protein
VFLYYDSQPVLFKWETRKRANCKRKCNDKGDRKVQGSKNLMSVLLIQETKEKENGLTIKNNCFLDAGKRT